VVVKSSAYSSPDDKINGKELGTCLGDEYSVNWMENTEASDLHETLQQQFEAVKGSTKGSHVQQFGDLNWVNEEISNYHGDIPEKREKLVIDEDYAKYLEKAKESRINSRDAKIHYLYNKAMNNNDFNSKQELTDELLHRRTVDRIFEKFGVNTTYTVIDFKCLKATVENFKSTCGQWSEYTLKYVRNMAVACETNSEDDIKAKFTQICQ